jgi:hypothetical protein
MPYMSNTESVQSLILDIEGNTGAFSVPVEWFGGGGGVGGGLGYREWVGERGRATDECGIRYFV